MKLNRYLPAIWTLGAIALLISVVRFYGVAIEQSAYAGDQQQQSATAEGLEVATFGSGCFWCTESDFDKVAGVVSTVSGYMGGKTKNPTYKSVSTGRTGHVEILQVTYDPKKVSYKKLLDYYWRTTDILDGGGQFCDRGPQYRPIIFAHTPQQRALAEKEKAKLNASGRFSRPVAVEIADASKFTAAEKYHQNYYRLNPLRYKSYRWGCGRDRRLMELWGDDAPTH